jgi:hypothetical protein
MRPVECQENRALMRENKARKKTKKKKRKKKLVPIYVYSILVVVGL